MGWEVGREDPVSKGRQLKNSKATLNISVFLEHDCKSWRVLSY